MIWNSKHRGFHRWSLMCTHRSSPWVQPSSPALQTSATREAAKSMFGRDREARSSWNFPASEEVSQEKRKRKPEKISSFETNVFLFDFNHKMLDSLVGSLDNE